MRGGRQQLIILVGGVRLAVGRRREMLLLVVVEVAAGRLHLHSQWDTHTDRRERGREERASERDAENRQGEGGHQQPSRVLRINEEREERTKKGLVGSFLRADPGTGGWREE